MKNSLPTLWFISAALMIVTATAIPAFIEPDMSRFARTAMLASTLPQGVLSGLSAVAFGLVHLLILRVRPSTAASVFGALHLGAALFGHAAQINGQVLRQQVILGTHDVSSTAQTMGMVHIASTLCYLLGVVFFIIAVAVALNTRPPAEDVF
ncbi:MULTISPECIES: hypothetical protein [unclassified Hyphomonas]|uniref:hypothetical protein n=1 Tax=unclassified Hyphomonas TaxID=2630699 RepID=UPI001A8D2A3C|nr:MULTISPECIES: hypothetical protein [unclassified Hyphomonas]MDF1805640.1 hypothetical protein [Hyphomonas sp.]